MEADLERQLDAIGDEMKETDRLIELQQRKLGLLKNIRDKLIHGERFTKTVDFDNIGTIGSHDSTKHQLNNKLEEKLSIDLPIGVKFTRMMLIRLKGTPTNGVSAKKSFQLICLVDHDGILHLLEDSGNELLVTNLGHTDSITSFAVDGSNPEEPVVVSTGVDGSIHVVSFQMHRNNVLVAGRKTSTDSSKSSTKHAAPVPGTVAFSVTVQNRYERQLHCSLKKDLTKGKNKSKSKAGVPEQGLGAEADSAACVDELLTPSSFATSSALFYNVNNKKHTVFLGLSDGSVARYEMMSGAGSASARLSNMQFPSSRDALAVTALARSNNVMAAVTGDQVHFFSIMQFTAGTYSCQSRHSIIGIAYDVMLPNLLIVTFRDAAGNVGVDMFNYRDRTRESKQEFCTFLSSHLLSDMFDLDKQQETVSVGCDGQEETCLTANESIHTDRVVAGLGFLLVSTEEGVLAAYNSSTATRDLMANIAPIGTFSRSGLPESGHFMMDATPFAKSAGKSADPANQGHPYLVLASSQCSSAQDQVHGRECTTALQLYTHSITYYRPTVFSWLEWGKLPLAMVALVLFLAWKIWALKGKVSRSAASSQSKQKRQNRAFNSAALKTQKEQEAIAELAKKIKSLSAEIGSPPDEE